MIRELQIFNSHGTGDELVHRITLADNSLSSLQRAAETVMDLLDRGLITREDAAANFRVLGYYVAKEDSA